MLQKIVKGYGNLFAGTARILALLGLCTLVGACIVLPLWAFATKAPALYTALVLILLIAGISLFLVKKALAAGIRRTVQVLLQLLVAGDDRADARAARGEALGNGVDDDRVFR